MAEDKTAIKARNKIVILHLFTTATPPMGELLQECLVNIWICFWDRVQVTETLHCNFSFLCWVKKPLSIVRVAHSHSDSKELFEENSD